MELPLEPTTAPRRGSLLTRVLHLANRRGRPETAAENSARLVPEQVAPPTELTGTPTEPASLEPELYLEARRHIKRRAWGHAQHALEEAARRDPESGADLDLQSVRAVRRALRRTSRWPSDVEAHLDLGRACFDLDLGDDALSEFVIAQRLAPERYEGFALAALEYLYRGEYTRAMGQWIKARERNPELPELDDVLGSLPAR